MAKTYILTRQQWVPRPIEAAFDFFSRASNLQSITPPWLDFHITEAPAEMRAGALLRYTLRIHKIPVRWKTEITEWNPPYGFVDEQISGPYELWHHEHTFTSDRGGTVIEDEVRYALPFGPLGRLAHVILVRRDLKLIFDYRSEKMREILGF